MTDDDDPRERDEPAGAGSATDPNAAFLAEVARLVPDATVVALPPPPAPPTDVPDPVLARDLAARLAAYVIAGLAAMWREALPGIDPPDEIHQRFFAEHHPQVLRAEASARRPLDDAVSAELAGAEVRLADAGWAVKATTRDSGATTIAGTSGDLRLNIVAAVGEGVLAARVVSGQLTVGDVGEQLRQSPATLPWPS